MARSARQAMVGFQAIVPFVKVRSAFLDGNSCGLVEPAAANALRRHAANEAHQEQQNDGADGGADDLADDARKLQKTRRQKARDDCPENAHDNVADKPKSLARIDKPGKPSGNRADHEHENNCDRIHGFPLVIRV